MNRATPAQLRRCASAANVLVRTGIRFVPMPVLDEQDNDRLVDQVAERLEILAQRAEKGGAA